jgi:capsular polysaccharide transport system ATP-binding protein
MIQLVGVAKAFAGRGRVPQIVLRPTTIGWPADRRVAILGERRVGKTTVLQMLAGKLSPDQGAVIAPLFFSPVVNTGGLFHPQLTGIDNIRFVARMFGVQADRLTLAVDAFCGSSLRLNDPIRAHDTAHRRAFEVAVTIVLPFACYLFDDVAQLPPDLLARCFTAARERGAGLVFSTASPRLARQFGEIFVVIADATLHMFTQAEEAIRFFGRQVK